MIASWDTDWEMAQACLAWQVEMGADEAICDQPVNRYALDSVPQPRVSAKPALETTSRVVDQPAVDPVQDAVKMAAASVDLAGLEAAMAAFAHCDLRQGARNLVFSDGQPNARIMIVGEAPGREEDLQGKPFVGEAGQLLNRMFAAIGIRRDSPDPDRALYITNILPWRPPQNRDPTSEERAMFRPFVLRHIALADPDIVILMGRISAGTLLGTSEGITRIRGRWREIEGRSALPMLHPAYLLRNPAAKRDAWADLLELQAKLRTLP